MGNVLVNLIGYAKYNRSHRKPGVYILANILFSRTEKGECWKILAENERENKILQKSEESGKIARTLKSGELKCVQKAKN
jgi:hypothetical protein